jgi:hypothetical protein
MTTIFMFLFICVCSSKDLVFYNGVSSRVGVILSFESAFNKREQVGVDDVGLRRDHAVRQIFVQAISRRSSDGKPALRRAITGGTAEKGI